MLQDASCDHRRRRCGCHRSMRPTSRPPVRKRCWRGRLVRAADKKPSPDTATGWERVGSTSAGGRPCQPATSATASRPSWSMPAGGATQQCGRPVFANTTFIAVHYLQQRRDELLAWMMDRADSQVAANVQFFIENTDALFGQLAIRYAGSPSWAGPSRQATSRPRSPMSPSGPCSPPACWPSDWRRANGTRHPPCASTSATWRRSRSAILGRHRR